MRFVPFGDADALRAAIGPDTGAVFLEPCLGEGGVVPAPEGYLRAAREACDQAGALLVVDEIQSGIGRSGRWFAHQAEGIRPDVLTLAKGLGGGLPIGACVGFGRCATGLARGDHGSTFGGNPVACAAALAVLDTLERDGLIAQAVTVGERLTAGLQAVGHPLVAGVRGHGLWQAVVLTAPRPRTWRPPPGRPGSWSTRSSPTPSGSPRRSSSAPPRPMSSWPRGPASSSRGPRDGPALPPRR